MCIRDRDGDGNEVIEMQEIEETTLTVYLHHTTPEQMAAAYGFTKQQNEHLALLRHEEYSVMWASLLGGFTHGGGIIGSGADWVGTVSYTHLWIGFCPAARIRQYAGGV